MSHTSTKRRHSTAHEAEHENHERWLVTYADMLTLLMVLFIVMFAISQVDQRKFNELKTGLAAGFGSPQSILSGAPGTLNDSTVSPTPINIGGFGGPESAAQTVANQRAAAVSQARSAEQEVQKLEGVRKLLLTALKAKGLKGDVLFRYDTRGLVITILTNQVIFPADLATLEPEGVRVLQVLGPVLSGLPNGLAVEGHTNQVGHPRFFPTEWELSVARAVTVVRYLIDHEGVSARRLSATGYADQRPLLPPSDPRASTVNRRVEIVVQSSLPADTRALIPTVAPADPNS